MPKKNLSTLFPVPFGEYASTFVQRQPRFILKLKGKSWQTVHHGLHDRYIRAHLHGELSVGSLARYYPEYGIVDVDEHDIDFINSEIRPELGMTKRDSMLCTSESQDSYHLIFRPVYRNKPPTVRLLNDIFQGFCVKEKVEIYPRAKKGVRLPFSVIQKCLDAGRKHLSTWSDKTLAFKQLSEYDLKNVPGRQLYFNDESASRPMLLEKTDVKLDRCERGRQLYADGLQAKHTRHESTLTVLFYFWRKGLAPETARTEAWRWIKAKHNGFSQEMQECPASVKADIERMVSWLWTNYVGVYPDETHNRYNGWLTKADVIEIFKVAGGSLPRARFLFHLVKYYYPRRYRDRVNVHSDLLKSWGSRDTYLDRVKELEGKGIVYRGTDYVIDTRSKEIKLKWKFKGLDDAVLVDERAPETLQDTLKAAFTEQEVRALLRTTSMHRSVISRFTREIFTVY